ncbi:non-homologous end-joining DNA ligase [Alloalcanivorax mobilis]|uniref:non-homologous end-joining DNA ligase n=1 Tax=Alloalcanivorax mobilis TaxID=2019569 RepID=UPI000B5B1701|nr:non-homologous end-joining DNA ligase [Alloalcanivorax mobilis]ASK35726.1 ATP-dependent DNA ligase [Alcanivorax sp. N3-2A]|tara:strand:+ start:14897 stop:15802 length:906 start_codon:yes stop_codon:yes gene_type:complete
MTEKHYHLDGHDIAVSHADKALFPEPKITKQALAEYYRRVAPVMLPHIKGRPLTLHRFPDGIGEDGFFQQARGRYFPEWLPARTIEHGGDTGEVTHVLCEHSADLVYLAGQAAIALHAWPSRQPELDKPSQLIFDLDPPGQDFEPVRQAALQLGQWLRERNITPFVKTTGSRGLHVVVPLEPELDFDRARDLARDMAAQLAHQHADTLTLEQRKDKRKGRLYLDIMRNAFGQTAVAPYSVRALPGAPVATPLEWSELDDARLTARRYTVANLFRRLGQRQDPWHRMEDQAVGAAALRKATG